jgi:hypothetical protein
MTGISALKTTHLGFEVAINIIRLPKKQMCRRKKGEVSEIIWRQYFIRFFSKLLPFFIQPFTFDFAQPRGGYKPIGFVLIMAPEACMTSGSTISIEGGGTLAGFSSGISDGVATQASGLTFKVNLLRTANV